MYPDAPEICWDFKDNDCNGKKDCDDDACTGDTTCLRRCDADRDTYQSISCGGADCHDNDALTYPSAPERIDGMDNDCNGLRDDLPVLFNLLFNHHLKLFNLLSQPYSNLLHNL